MEDEILQLYPLPARELPLQGLYLRHDLRQFGQTGGRAFVYSNFINSLDGRIAIPHPSGRGSMVPKQITNPRDWRLFQELAIQADLFISSGRYLRDYADGRAQEILRVYDEPLFADLKDWRRQRGLPPYPDLAVISASLDFPIPDVLVKGDRTLLVYTGEDASPERRRSLEKQGARVISAGEQGVDGRLLVASLSGLGYRIVYSGTGPQVLHMLLEGDLLDRLYLTHANRILGGQPYSTIVEGGLLEPALDFDLQAAYLDPHALGGVGQLLTLYERRR